MANEGLKTILGPVRVSSESESENTDQHGEQERGEMIRKEKRKVK